MMNMSTLCSDYATSLHQTKIASPSPSKKVIVISGYGDSQAIYRILSVIRRNSVLSSSGKFKKRQREHHKSNRFYFHLFYLFSHSQNLIQREEKWLIKL